MDGIPEGVMSLPDGRLVLVTDRHLQAMLWSALRDDAEVSDELEDSGV